MICGSVVFFLNPCYIDMYVVFHFDNCRDGGISSVIQEPNLKTTNKSTVPLFLPE